MTEPAAPTPAPPAEPDTVPGWAGRIERWFEDHIAPDVAEIKGDAKTALEYVAAHAVNVNAVAGLLLKVVQAADPAAAPAVAALAAEAEKITADTARVAGELAAKI